MRNNMLLKVTSALTAFLFSIHWIQDVVLGIDKVGIQSIGGVGILFLWMVAVLVLAEHRAGQVLMLILGFLAVGVTALHFNSPRIQERALGDGGFAFLWVMALMGTTGALSFLLAILALRGQRRANATPS